MAKTNAEMCKNYYNRKKAAKEAEKIQQGLPVKKPIKKTGAERTRACRLRKKMLLQVNESSVTEIVSIPSTSNSGIKTFEPQLATTSASTNQPAVSTVSSSGIADHDERLGSNMDRIVIKTEPVEGADDVCFPDAASAGKQEVIYTEIKIEPAEVTDDHSLEKEMEVQTKLEPTEALYIKSAVKQEIVETKIDLEMTEIIDGISVKKEIEFVEIKSEPTQAVDDICNEKSAETMETKIKFEATEDTDLSDDVSVEKEKQLIETNFKLKQCTNEICSIYAVSSVKPEMVGKEIKLESLEESNDILSEEEIGLVETRLKPTQAVVEFFDAESAVKEEMDDTKIDIGVTQVAGLPTRSEDDTPNDSAARLDIDLVDNTSSSSRIEKLRECSLCGYKSRNGYYWRKHMQTHTGEQPHACPKCYLTYSTKSSLKRHMHTHEDKNFKCSKCPYRTNVKTYLDDHMRIHTGEKPYQCSKCPYKCSTGTGLSSHKLSIHNVRTELIKCPNCYFTTRSKSSFKKHMKTTIHLKK